MRKCHFIDKVTQANNDIAHTIMNKKDLIDIIQAELGPDASKKAATDALNATLTAITKAVATDKIQLIGFGTFETKTRPARSGMNPLTKQPMQIPASTYVSFKPSSALKSKG